MVGSIFNEIIGLIWAHQWIVHVVITSLCHVICHVALLTFALWTPCHLTWMPCHLPCGCPVGCHIAPHHLLCGCHVVATSSATMSVTTSSATSSSMSASNASLQVMWQVNPWRSLSSQILGFGLGSWGFTPIYDGLKTSWITSIHDENVNTSREVICDVQYVTKWNFVIDAILWRKLHDPWRKSTVIDHKVFCSVYY
jgi:hypothetical protein